MRHHFNAEQWLPYPVELVFAFFSNPENLPRLMPTWQKARIEEATFAPPPPHPPGPRAIGGGVTAGAGTRLTLSFRPVPLSPIRIPWDAEISEFVWNDHFCDTQLRGPFAFWHHCHYVREESRIDNEGVTTAGTLVTDQVEYEMKFGAIGEFAGRLGAPLQFRYLFNYRHKRTSELLAKMTGRRTI